MHLLAPIVASLVVGSHSGPNTTAPSPDALSSPILFRGDDKTAYRDPTAIYHGGTFHIFFTLVKTGEDGAPFLHVAASRSRDLVSWSKPRPLMPADRSLNYSSA